MDRYEAETKQTLALMKTNPRFAGMIMFMRTRFGITLLTITGAAVMILIGVKSEIVTSILSRLP